MILDWQFAALSLFTLAFLAFARARLLSYLHFYQQEEYDSPRFMRWLIKKRALDLRASVVLVTCGILPLLLQSSWIFPVSAAIAALGLLVQMTREPDPRKSGKKRLAMTARATRIFWTSFSLIVALSLALLFLRTPLLGWIIAVQALPLVVAIGNLLLTPYESAIQQRLWSEAHNKLLKLQPTVIGITGSFGKTSVKHILGHLLDSQAATLITPGSVNTPMGITRIVREQLGPQHRYFVCEMGAYGPGSIARLCRLAPPDIGVITAIGHAHYERFRSLDTVAQAKFELAEAAAARGGKTIVAAKVLEQPAAQAFQNQHRDKVIVVGNHGEMQIMRARQERTGLVFEGVWQGTTYSFRAPLFGLHHCDNIALAFTTACVLGCKPADVVAAVSTIPQIRHRLEVTQAPGGWVLVDDAYNSNPVGFAAALELLDVLQNPGGRRIVVTPGMVELGTAHDEEHRKIGMLAARHVDVLIPVLPERITTLVNSFREGSPSATIIPCRSFDEARAWLDKNATINDVVLVENDLPDLYESKVRL